MDAQNFTNSQHASGFSVLEEMQYPRPCTVIAGVFATGMVQIPRSSPNASAKLDRLQEPAVIIAACPAANISVPFIS